MKWDKTFLSTLAWLDPFKTLFFNLVNFDIFTILIYDLLMNSSKGILTRFWGVLTTFKDWTLSFQHCLNILNTEMGYILADDMTYSSQRLRHRTPPAKLISVLLLQPYPQTKAIRVTHKKEKQMYVICTVHIIFCTFCFFGQN